MNDKQAQIQANRQAANQFPEDTDVVPVQAAPEPPKVNVWIVDGCGGMYKRAAEAYRPSWGIVPTPNEAKMIDSFMAKTELLEANKKSMPDVMLLRSFDLVDYNGLTVLDEVYIFGDLRISGEGDGLTTHPYLAEMAPSVEITHLGWGDEATRAKDGKVKCLTVGSEGEFVARFAQKFYVCR